MQDESGDISHDESKMPPASVIANIEECLEDASSGGGMQILYCEPVGGEEM